MTEELNEKYIYKLSDNKYRIKFLKIEPGTKKRLYFNLNFEGTLEQAINIRNEKLKEFGLELNKPPKIDILE